MTRRRRQHLVEYAPGCFAREGEQRFYERLGPRGLVYDFEDGRWQLLDATTDLYHLPAELMSRTGEEVAARTDAPPATFGRRSVRRMRR